MTCARGVAHGNAGLPIHWLGRVAVLEPLPGQRFLTATALAGELCAVLDAGAAGLVIQLPGTGVCDAATLEALTRAARRARGWGSWLRLVVPDPRVRRLVRLVAMDEVMPVHASLTGAVAAAARETSVGGL